MTARRRASPTATDSLVTPWRGNSSTAPSYPSLSFTDADTWATSWCMRRCSCSPSRVADDEGVAQAVIVDGRPDRSQQRPDAGADVLLDVLEQARADDRERDLVTRHGIVGLWFERADGLGRPHDQGAQNDGVQKGMT